MLGSLLTLFAVGLVSLVALGIVLSIVGVVFSVTFGIATFLLFKVAPIILVGWVVLKIFEKTRGGSDRLTPADRRWLDQA